MREVLIDLDPGVDVEEQFEKADKHVLRARVQLPTGEIVEGNGYRVELALSRDAMVGLGTSLIRAAHSDGAEINFWHLNPVDKDLISQNFGVLLHPRSCEVLIAEEEFATIYEILNEGST